ncbi:hypothetical protein ACWCV9_35090 [Streptomyces sp. NPDC001606]
MLASLVLGGCSPQGASSTGHTGTPAQPTSATPAASAAGSGMLQLTARQLEQRLLAPGELGPGYRSYGGDETGVDQSPAFRTLKPGSAACIDAMASFAMNPRVGRLSAEQYATRDLGNPTTRAAVSEWVGSFSSPARAERALNNLLRDAAACPAGVITSPTPAAPFTLTRLPAPRYGDQSAELLCGMGVGTTPDPLLIVRYGANLMALTIDTPHNRDTLVSAAAKAANKRFTS